MRTGICVMARTASRAVLHGTTVLLHFNSAVDSFDDRGGGGGWVCLGTKLCCLQWWSALYQCDMLGGRAYRRSTTGLYP